MFGRLGCKKVCIGVGGKKAWSGGGKWIACDGWIGTAPVPVWLFFSSFTSSVKDFTRLFSSSISLLSLELEGISFGWVSAKLILLREQALPLFF